ncbi:PREDICTED: ubinuclein-1 [Prunus dulcis]|uniref:PREDICTED: ubinuclein-1 n=1 Tax=Prunus dulcis TaxID=3755 RepID=A0A5E4GF62_PRUDU|nr:PREDICTED: ubinuclein-1 [Prunus dulcis]
MRTESSGVGFHFGLIFNSVNEWECKAHVEFGADGLPSPRIFDEYDTEYSFIDDAELDEYFKVDNSAIKHDGFFVNRGKLERIVTAKTAAAAAKITLTLAKNSSAPIITTEHREDGEALGKSTKGLAEPIQAHSNIGNARGRL